MILAPLAVLGAVVLWRRGKPGLVVLLAAPVLLAPGGVVRPSVSLGGARVLVYAAPALVLLIGAGTPPAWDWLRRRHRLAPAGLALLFLPPLYAAGQRRRPALGAGGHGRGLRLRRVAPGTGRRRRGQRLDASVLFPPARPGVPSQRRLRMRRIAAGLFTRRSSRRRSGLPAPSAWGRRDGSRWSGTSSTFTTVLLLQRPGAAGSGSSASLLREIVRNGDPSNTLRANDASRPTAATSTGPYESHRDAGENPRAGWPWR